MHAAALSYLGLAATARSSDPFKIDASIRLGFPSSALLGLKKATGFTSDEIATLLDISAKTILELKVLPLFSGRVLPFDVGCTHAYAELMAKARASGLVIASANGYIAAIAAANGLTVATRYTGPFEAAGAAVINPWQA